MRDNLKEYEAVAKAAENFVRSVAEGDSKYAKTLFTEDAVLFGILDGVLEHGSIEQFYHNVEPETTSWHESTYSRSRKLSPWSAFWKKAGEEELISPTSSFS